MDQNHKAKYIYVGVENKMVLKSSISDIHKKSNLAPLFINAASFHASRLQELEEDIISEECLDGSAELMKKYSDRQRAYFYPSILLSICGLEAYINGFYQECVDFLGDPYKAQTTYSKINTVDILNDIVRHRIDAAFESENLITKFEWINTKLNLGLKQSSKWEDIKLLLKIRNDLVHYKPLFRNTQESLDDYRDLIEFLKKRRLLLNPIADYSSDPFPHGIVSFSIANWAVDSVNGFNSEFERVIGRAK